MISENEISKLRERLAQAERELQSEFVSRTNYQLMTEQHAATILELRAEVERLQKELESWKNCYSGALAKLDIWKENYPEMSSIIDDLVEGKK